MYERDLRDIKLFGQVAVVAGAMLMACTFVGVAIALVAGGTTIRADWFKGGLTCVTALIMASAMVGTGGEMQRSNVRAAASPTGLRLDCTALFITMLIGFGMGLWLMQALSMIASFMLIGLMWTRSAVIHVTTRR